MRQITRRKCGAQSSLVQTWAFSEISFSRKRALTSSASSWTLSRPVSSSTAIIDGGLAAPGLHARVLIQKYLDHLPLYRIEKISDRHGVPIARSTLDPPRGGCALGGSG